jgi:tetratricopeptide (TPR) repeat protein
MAPVIFCVALAVRLIHIFQIKRSPFFDVLLGDANGYDAWARRLADGDWIGTEVFYQAPLYPYFLGVVYAVAGRDLLLVRLLQAAIGSASCALLSLAGARLFTRRAGWIAGLALALYAPAVFFDGLLQKSVLDLLLICLGLWLMARMLTGAPTRGWWIALGLAMGALALTRENAVVFIAVILVWAVMRPGSVRPFRHAAWTGMRLATRDINGRALGWFLFGLAVVLLPVAARNSFVGGGFYLTTSQFGPNFYIGNHQGADGTYVSLRPGRGAPEHERQDATDLAEYALKRRLTPAEVSDYWTGRALSFITSSPVEWLTLLARKATLLVNTSEMLDTESQESYAEVSWPLRLLGVVGHFGVVVPLAGFGMWVSWSDRRKLWPVYAMLAAYAASVVAFYVFARYRFPLVPFLLLFAAAGVTTIPAWVRTAGPRRLTSAGITFALAAVGVNWPLLSAARMRAITDTNLGTAFYEGGRLSDAEASYRRAIETQPDYAPAYNNLGVVQRAQGRLEEAIRTYRNGLAQMPDYPDLHYNLGNALMAQGQHAEAADHLKRALAGSPVSAASHNNLGMALAGQGRTEEALSEFRAAIAADPGSTLAHRNLGNALASIGRRGEALDSLTRATVLSPTDAAARYDLGSLLLEVERFEAAEVEFRAALAAAPESVEAMNNLGIALASQGRIADALAQFDRAVQLNPTFADARTNRERARQALRK